MRAVAVIVVLAACGGARPRAPSPPAVVVVESGAEPRQQLRFIPPPSVPERTEVRLKMRMTTAFTNTVLDKGRLDVDLPTILLVSRLEGRPSPDGDTLIGYEIEATSVLADVVDRALYRVVEPEVASLKGIRGSWWRSPTGQVSEVAVDLAKATPAVRAGIGAVTDSLHEASALFPEAAIGIGAVWRSSSDYVHSGVHWRRTVTYRLKDLADDIATVEISAAMHASAQVLSVEPNATKRLTSGEMTVTQVLVVPLRGVAATGDSHESSDLNLLIVDGHLRITSTVHTDLVLTFKRLAN